ncbi:hypothetical protein N7G274_003254 [Stereocaulon virgatum]|uniref:Uncharacterized protein n=1 Tax=Stereocaulon virgatum TaxID=373712 RepID=A0ABR4AE34_9LECA
MSASQSQVNLQNSESTLVNIACRIANSSRYEPLDGHEYVVIPKPDIGESATFSDLDSEHTASSDDFSEKVQLQRDLEKFSQNNDGFPEEYSTVTEGSRLEFKRLFEDEHGLNSEDCGDWVRLLDERIIEGKGELMIPS